MSRPGVAHSAPFPSTSADHARIFSLTCLAEEAQATAVEEPLHKSRRKRNLKQKQPKTKINITVRTHKNLESQPSMLGKMSRPGVAHSALFPSTSADHARIFSLTCLAEEAQATAVEEPLHKKQKKTQSETKTTENEDQHHSTHPQKQ